jgi:probable LLM family oxidoreductase
MELGVYSFGDLSADPATGVTISARERLGQLIEEIVLADAVGLDVFGVGEHHRADYTVSAPAVVLAAAAARTSRIRLASAVTVLSSDDPVRVFQDFATLDLLSNGRAEIIAGRGSFIESFPLFGQDLADYDDLFSDKLDLLLRLRESAVVTYEGSRHRAPIAGRGVYPRPLQNPLPVWIAVGGTPQSVARAGALGLPLAIAIIGGEPERFAPLVGLYREAARRAGQDPAALKVGINTHGFLADTSEAAADLLWPYYAATMSRIGRERGWPPMQREAYEAGRAPRGHLAVGSPAEMIDKILSQHAVFGHDRHLMQLGVGTLPHQAVLRAIELYGTVVAPAVRKAVAERQPAAATA